MTSFINITGAIIFTSTFAMKPQVNITACCSYSSSATNLG